MITPQKTVDVTATNLPTRLTIYTQILSVLEVGFPSGVYHEARERMSILSLGCV